MTDPAWNPDSTTPDFRGLYDRRIPPEFVADAPPVRHYWSGHRWWVNRSDRTTFCPQVGMHWRDTLGIALRPRRAHRPYVAMAEASPHAASLQELTAAFWSRPAP